MQKSAAKRNSAAEPAAVGARQLAPKASGALAAAQRMAAAAQGPALQGKSLPGTLRSGIESLSGRSLGDVRVHYNSPKPARLDALAYAQGRDIHLARGQERHLPHEAWHVVQQAQGRVRPTLRLGDAVPVNDDKALEREADTMGRKAAALGAATVQRAVPTNADLPKPVAVTGTYAAQNAARLVRYSSANQPRRDFAFGQHTRAEVLARFHPTYRDGEIESVRVVTGSQENASGVQLDHRISWHNISAFMDQRNATAYADDPDPAADDVYSLWDARMYYNDQTNLQPALGSENAGGGAHGVHAAPEINDDLAQAVAQTHAAWMATQRSANAFDPHIADGGELGVVVERFEGIADSMNALRVDLDTERAQRNAIQVE